MTTTAILSLNAALALAAFYLVWHFGWRQFRIDSMRQELFKLRDELFMMAARGEHGLTFDTPIYGEMRRMFNVRIRYAHSVTAFCALVSLPILWVFGITPKTLEEFKEARIPIGKVENKELRDALTKLESRTARCMLFYLLTTSPLVMSMVLFTVVVGICAAIIQLVIACCRGIVKFSALTTVVPEAVACRTNKEAETIKLATDMFAESQLRGELAAA